MTVQLTPKQRENLVKAADSPVGVVDLHCPRGFRRSAWERMMERLRTIGLVTPYVHGGYEITYTGKAALKEIGE